MFHIPCISSVSPLLPPGLGLPSSGFGSLISGTARGRDTGAHCRPPTLPRRARGRGDVYISCIGTSLARLPMVARLVSGFPSSRINSRIVFSRLVWNFCLVFGEGCMNSTAYLLLCPFRCACLLLALSPRVSWLLSCTCTLLILFLALPHRIRTPHASVTHHHHLTHTLNNCIVSGTSYHTQYLLLPRIRIRIR
ncbi:hypothetical protein L226DRAFT_329127 [Lentinus tigrinus ALCF2SS1-7]|uniref:Uncharacterized protein n=1 Tax=Lentinus tigrinus ALCF2SS1-6 TaxID=1328759 RepID=A0A5C2SFE9_9APHY|nr:hypothetical protein L227DRAFT_429285 [Lentinus tigrinus ALCF2SS1-6]RPD77686.1 hypothetical protein L226DRAFT_329127 [Lentinus tigrinus ALCF2SS1-7]